MTVHKVKNDTRVVFLTHNFIWQYSWATCRSRDNDMGVVFEDMGVRRLLSMLSPANDTRVVFLCEVLLQGSPMQVVLAHVLISLQTESMCCIHDSSLMTCALFNTPCTFMEAFKDFMKMENDRCVVFLIKQPWWKQSKW